MTSHRSFPIQGRPCGKGMCRNQHAIQQAKSDVDAAGRMPLVRGHWPAASIFHRWLASITVQICMLRYFELMTYSRSDLSSNLSTSDGVGEMHVDLLQDFLERSKHSHLRLACSSSEWPHNSVDIWWTLRTAPFQQPMLRKPHWSKALPEMTQESP